jgi:rsbT co-antagonist protein RsbR
MDIAVIEYARQHKKEILNKWVALTMESGDNRVVEGDANHGFISASSELIDLMITSINGNDELSTTKLSDFINKVIRLGWPLNFILEGVQTFRKILFEDLLEEGMITESKLLDIVNDFDVWITPIVNKFVNVYSSSWEKTVSLQKIALQELSAPLIPIFEGITVMPLVGTIDTERARQLMENLLDGVVFHQSDVVLIDITGVPVVDTMVAHHIIQAANAVQLLGAKCILCGIRPEIAQTIVHLGINLKQITTKSTLKKGVEAALALTERKIVVVGGEK